MRQHLYRWLINGYSRSWKSIMVVTQFQRFDGTSEILFKWNLSPVTPLHYDIWHFVILSSVTPTKHCILGTLVTCMPPSLWHLDNYQLFTCHSPWPHLSIFGQLPHFYLTHPLTWKDQIWTLTWSSMKTPSVLIWNVWVDDSCWFMITLIKKIFDTLTFCLKV